MISGHISADWDTNFKFRAYEVLKELHDTCTGHQIGKNEIAPQPGARQTHIEDKINFFLLILASFDLKSVAMQYSKRIRMI